MPRRGRVAHGQQAEAILNPRQDLLGGHGPQPDRSQLNCQRDPLKPSAQLGDRLLVAGVDREPGQDRRAALGEQAHRLVLQQAPGGCQLALRWDRHGRNRDCHFPGHAEHLAAGGENAKLRAGPQECPGQHGTCVEEMLAVVQYQQSLAAREIVRQRGHGPAGRLIKQAERPSDLRGKQRRVPQPRQLHHPGAVAETAAHLGRRLNSQPCLADAARAGERDQSRAGQRRPDAAELCSPPDEPAQLGAEPAARPGRMVAHK